MKERYYLEDIAALTVTTISDTATSEIAYTHKDRLGSTVALVDHDGGDPLEFHSFDPFGKPNHGRAVGLQSPPWNWPAAI